MPEVIPSKPARTPAERPSTNVEPSSQRALLGASQAWTRLKLGETQTPHPFAYHLRPDDPQFAAYKRDMAEIENAQLGGATMEQIQAEAVRTATEDAQVAFMNIRRLERTSGSAVRAAIDHKDEYGQYTKKVSIARKLGASEEDVAKLWNQVQQLDTANNTAQPGI